MKYQRKDIEGYPGYQIDTNGDVWSYRANSGKLKDTPHKLATHRYGGRYVQVGIRRDKRQVANSVHRLLGLAFILNPENKPMVLHKDGDTSNNAISNLYWGTGKENAADREKHGTGRSIGIKNGHAKLSEKQVRVIKWGIHYGADIIEMAKCFNVTNVAIHQIKWGKTWKHVTI